MIPVQAAPLWAYGIGATFAVAAGRQLQWWERSVRGEGSVRGAARPIRTGYRRLPGAAEDLKVPRVLAVLIAGAGVYVLVGVPDRHWRVEPQ